MKPRIPSQKGNYRKLNARLGRYVALVREIYRQLNREAASIATRTAYAQAKGQGKPFRFADYPETRVAVRRMQRQLADSIEAAILRGTSEEWTQGNLAADLVADRALATYRATVRGEKRTILYQTNPAALQAFQQRADRGMNLSAKIWNQAADYKSALEAAISCAVGKGTSAVTLSKRLSQYLLDFPSLRKDYKERFGKAADIRDCEYRSACLARSEINMAYRTAEQLRWQQFDFVLGYEIKLSSSHPAHDVCDDLAGRYPKDFKWTGWHPNDLCYAVPILQSEEEFWKLDDGKGNDAGSVNEVKDVPDAFKRWVLENQQRINKAQKKNTLPYFLKDNRLIIQNITLENSVKDIVNRASLVGNEVQSLAEYIAKKNKGFVTPINYKSISSIIRKVEKEGITPYDIKDAVRTTIIVPKSKINQVLSDLSEDDSFLRMKRQKSELLGYSGNIVNIKTSNGLIAEIQVNTEQMIYAKESPENAKRILGEKLWEKIRKQTGIEGGLGHKYYEEWRVLDKADKKAQKIAEKSIDYYSHFQ